MGDFRLGCLLGQYDKAQSFDVSSVALTGASTINSWNLNSVADVDYDFQLFTSDVHSSSQSLRLDVSSAGDGQTLAFYTYGHDDDAYAKWFPDVTTHAFEASIWARVTAGANSGYIRFGGLNNANADIQATIGTTGNLEKYSISFDIFSAGIQYPRVHIRANENISSLKRSQWDDVLSMIDPITIHPEYSYKENARLNKNERRTLGGNLHTYKWSKSFAWNVPLEYLSDSHTDLINWWWTNQFNLAFTIDTSDAESTYTCRIVNDRQPIHTLHRSYNDTWKGVLQLESIDQGSLVF